MKPMGLRAPWDDYKKILNKNENKTNKLNM